MREESYQQLARVERDHWWFTSRQTLIREAVTRVSGRSHFSRALDAGCGTGVNLPLLRELADEVEGFDKSETAVTLARNQFPKESIYIADINAPPKSPAPFQLITVLHVLYHRWVENEVKVLSQLSDCLEEKGYLVITDAAFKCLVREQDAQSFGARRYSLKEMQTLVEKAGLKVHFITYFNSPSFLPALANKYLQKGQAILRRILGRPQTHRKLSELKPPPKWVNALMSSLLDLERLFIRRFGRVPFGVNLLCIASK